MAVPTWYCPVCKRHYGLKTPRCTKCGILKPEGEWEEGVREAEYDPSARERLGRPSRPRPIKVEAAARPALARIEVKQDEAARLVRPHLSDDEVPQHVSIGFVYRGHWFLWYLLAWSPLFLLASGQLLGARSGAIGFIMAAAWAIIVNVLLRRRFLIAKTDQRILLVGMKRFQTAERNHSGWPLGQVSAARAEEGRHSVRFDLQTPVRTLRLEFRVTSLEGNKSSASATYNEILKTQEQDWTPPASPAAKETAASTAWLRKEQIHDRVLTTMAWTVAIWILAGLLLTASGQDTLTDHVMRRVRRVQRMMASPLSLRVPAGFTSSIVVPACQEQREEAGTDGDTYLCMDSSPGDWVGDGRTWFHTPASDPFSASYSEYFNSVRVTVGRLGGSQWDLNFDGPDEQEWIVGALYQNPWYPAPQASSPLDVGGYSRGCGSRSARFEILELEYDRSAREVLRFAANFEQGCNEGPPLLGILRFNSTVR